MSGPHAFVYRTIALRSFNPQSVVMARIADWFPSYTLGVIVPTLRLDVAEAEAFSPVLPFARSTC